MIKGMSISFTKEEKKLIMEQLKEVLDSGHLIWGKKQQELQQIFCQMTGKKHAVTFNSATSAIEALLHALWDSAHGIVRIAFQGNAFPSPVFAARRQGVLVVWLDIDPIAISPSLEEIERQYKAHPFQGLALQEIAGFIPDWMPAVRGWCQENGVFLLEDCAQSVGTIKFGRSAGSFGDAAVFSLAATKPFTTGQGGVVVTDDDRLAQKLFHLKNYGRTELFQKGDFVDKGWNFHMTELQAAVGVALYQTMNKRIEQRAEIAKLYYRELTGLVRFCGHLAERQNWYKLPVLLPGSQDKVRDAVTARMLDKGIELGSPLYSFVTAHLPVLNGPAAYELPPLPLTWYYARQHICLPLHNDMSLDDAQYVVRCLKEVL